MPVLPSTKGKSGMIFMPHIVGQVWPSGYLCPKEDFDEKIISSTNLSKLWKPECSMYTTKQVLP